MERDDDLLKNELKEYIKELGETDQLVKKVLKSHIEDLKKSDLKKEPNKVIIKEKKKKSFINWLFNRK